MEQTTISLNRKPIYIPTRHEQQALTKSETLNGLDSTWHASALKLVEGVVEFGRERLWFPGPACCLAETPVAVWGLGLIMTW